MNRKAVCAFVIGMVFIVVFIAAMARAGPVLGPLPPQAIPMGTVMWKDRTLEALLQGFILLAGVFSILLLLGHGSSGGRRP